MVHSLAQQAAAARATVLAMLALTGYWYGARQLYDIARVTGITSPAATAFFALSIGLLTARTRVGPLAAIVGHRPGSTMARRLLPAG